MISVIIPAYNAQEYIEECLDSVLAQTFTDLEIIVINDGSTDRTSEILDKYAAADSRIRIVNRPNGGLSAARNSGLEVAKGDYIFFIDSDDTIRPQALSILSNLLVTTRADLALGGWSKSPDDEGVDDFELGDAEDVVVRMLYQRGLSTVVWGVLYKRELIGDLRFWDGVYYEDIDFMPRLLMRAQRVAISHKILLFYRQHPDSIVHRYTPKRFDVLKVTERLEKDLGSHSKRLLQAIRDRRLSANFNMLGLICAVGDNSRKETADGCWQLIKEYRRESLFNPNVRLKNKIGIIISLFGRRVFEAIAKRVYK